MTSVEHEKLVSVIRGVHEKLRRAYSAASGDYEKVWEDHLYDAGLREQYSSSMLKLATTIWSKHDSRIEWCYKICMTYFRHGGLEKAIRKEERLRLRTGIIPETPIKETVFSFRDSNCKIKLLDVGSCYNPFSRYDDFICFPVDLTPATEDVHQCDFLWLKIIPEKNTTDNCLEFCNPLTELSENMFHVVVFSLVLEYLPAPEQRLIFCEKAFKLLQENGLLIIITPDSKSQLHNAPMIKSWKTSLKSIGFERLCYEKQTHIHCMAFRKTSKIMYHIDPGFVELAKLMYIPQDFKKYSDSEVNEIVNRTEEENENVRLSFDELPEDQEVY